MPRGVRLAAQTLAYAVIAVTLAAGLAQAWFYAHVLWWKSHNPDTSAFMRARLDAKRAADPAARLQHVWTDYERISVHLKRAVIASEDARFMLHDGFDWRAIRQAVALNERTGRVVAGASTITQQLAKNLFLGEDRSWLRKGQETVITGMLEHALSKRRILELYLNLAEWGDGVFGADAAARYHFGVRASALDARQAAWLAATLPSPRRYHRGFTTDYLEQRVKTILVRMPGAQIP